MPPLRKMITAAGDALAETLWPTRCVVCESPGSLLCHRCELALPFIDLKGACPRCGAPHGALACTECAPGQVSRKPGFPAGQLPDRGLGQLLDPEANQPPGKTLPSYAFSQARCTLSFCDGARKIVTAFKDAGEQRLAPLIARLMAQAAKGRQGPAPLAAEARAAPETSQPSPPQLLEDWSVRCQALVPVPISRASLRARGFDHMAAVSLELSRLLGLPLVDALRTRPGSLDQRHLSQDQRSQNQRNRFFTVTSGLPHSVLLADDVLTTGATVNSATEALLSTGAKEVLVLTLARVW